MSDLTWRQLIHKSRQAPPMFGVFSGSLLSGSVRAPLQLVFETRAFTNPTRGLLSVSPHQYHWILECGTLRKEICEVIPWQDCDLLHVALGASLKQVREMRGRWAKPFQSNTNPLAWFSCNLWFAEAGMMAIRTPEGIWSQFYRSGWPVTPPLLTEGIDNAVGLMIAASLSTEWFEDLPFTLEGVESKLLETWRPKVEVTWHERNDLFGPQRTVPAWSDTLLRSWLEPVPHHRADKGP